MYNDTFKMYRVITIRNWNITLLSLMIMLMPNEITVIECYVHV